MKNYSIYLFDFDYTLADSSQGIVKCYTHVLHQNGFMNVDPYAIKRTIGKTLEDSFEELTGIHDETTIQEMKKAYVKYADQVMNQNTFLFPEVKNVLATLHKRGAKVGIVSTKYRYRIQSFLEAKDCMQYIDLIVGGEDVTVHKPSPEGVEKAIKILSDAIGTPISKQTCLYLGDSVIDAQTAQAAEVPFCGVLHGTTTQEELTIYPHTHIVSSLTELL